LMTGQRIQQEAICIRGSSSD